MGLEIERKYLVVNDSYKNLAERTHRIVQGYLCREPERTVRVRIKDKQGFITIKGANCGELRLEFEYEIPIEDAESMLKMCYGRIIDKTRYCVPFAGLMWEIDEFHGDLDSLIVAEVELKTSETKITKPDFVGEEVTGNAKYYNSQL